MNAEVEVEARRQVERDLREQLSRDGGECVACRQMHVTLIDGRCIKCYCARTEQIFGVTPIITLA